MEQQTLILYNHQSALLAIIKNEKKNSFCSFVKFLLLDVIMHKIFA